jgi:hypothetical protein
MNNTHLKYLSVTGVAGGTRPRGSLALIHDSQPQAERHCVIASQAVIIIVTCRLAAGSP